MKGLVDYYIVSQYKIEDELRKELSNKLNAHHEDMTFEDVTDEFLDCKIKEIFEI